MAFDSEEDLVNSFCSRTTRLPFFNFGAKYYLARELEMSYGRPDIVYYSPKSGAREKFAIGNLIPDWAYALRVVPLNKTITLDYFTALSGRSEFQSRKVLNQFVEAGYVSSSGKGQWKKIKQVTSNAQDIVAIEAKLTDWRRALRQAAQHHDFAFHSWVLLDEATANAATDNLESFKRCNVGLMSLDENSRLRIYFHPNRRKPKESARSWSGEARLVQKIRAAIGPPSKITSKKFRRI